MSTIPDTTHAAPATAAADAREKRLEETVGALIRRSVVSRVDRNMEEWKAWMLATQLIARMRELSGSAGGTDTADPRWREAFHMLSLQSNLSSVEAHFVARVTLSLVRSAATSVQPIDERVPSGDIGELSNTHEFATAFKTLAQDSFVRSLRHFFMQETEAGMRDPRTGEDDELSETIAGIADDLIGRDTGYLSGRLHLGFLRGIANACAKAETEAEKHAIVMARLRTRKE